MKDLEKQRKHVTDGARLLTLLRPVVKELAELHSSGRVHGGISPETVRGCGRLRFCFSLSGKMNEIRPDTGASLFRLETPVSSGSSSGSRVGVWIPLEQLLGAGQPDPCGDVYSLCAVLYYMLTGAEPPDVQSRVGGAAVKKPSELGVSIPSRQEEALMKGLSLLGKDRQTDGRELYQDLYGEKKKREGSALREGWHVSQDEVIKKGGLLNRLRRIDFLDEIPSVSEEKWDISEQRDGSVMAWLEEKEDWYELRIGGEGGVIGAPDSQMLFFGCENVERICFHGHFDTRHIRSMNGMFLGCGSLTDLDVSGFDTAQVTDMEEMFSGCGSLTSLDVSGFDTSRVTDMGGMFSGCGSLASLDVSGFDTSRVENMGGMFQDCAGLTSLDVSGFDTSRVAYMGLMFAGCTGLRSLDISGFSMASLEYGGREDMLAGTRWASEDEMYADSDIYEASPGVLRENWQVRNYIEEPEKIRSVSFMDTIDWSAAGLEDISEEENESVMAWVTQTDGWYDLYIGGEGGVIASSGCQCMFARCVNVKRIRFNGNFDTSRVVNMSLMFSACKSLEELDLSGFDTSQTQYMIGMFQGCAGLTSLDLSGFRTARVKNMSSMFDMCSGLTSLRLDSFDTSAVKTMGFMFRKCSRLTSLDLSHFNTSQVQNMESMFAGCASLEHVNLSSFDTSHVENMTAMFRDCGKLSSLEDISRFDMSGVKEKKDMLKGTRWGV